jgi:outer membrane protein assembly factor BamE (lipoprotein component of BamABCDE complex)
VKPTSSLQTFSLRTLLVATSLLCIALACLVAWWPRFPSVKATDSVQVGMTEDEVEHVLGPPNLASMYYHSFYMLELNWRVGFAGHSRCSVWFSPDKRVIRKQVVAYSPAW